MTHTPTEPVPSKPGPVATTTVPAAATTTITGAIIGLILWALQTYAFPTGIPSIIVTAIPIVVIPAFGFLAHVFAVVTAKIK